MVLPDSPELVKIVSQSMPGASIESILEEVRNLIIQTVVDDVSKHNIKSSMETIEYIIQTYNMTSEDTGIVMKRLNHNEFVDSQFFESIYGYVNMKCLNDTDLMCWSGLKKLICTRNKCK